jgi:hypothetical protein
MIPLTKSELKQAIESLTPEQRRVTPFPSEWVLPHQRMIELIDAGVVGMDGFQYQFVEYARQCRATCRRAQGLL